MGRSDREDNDQEEEEFDEEEEQVDDEEDEDEEEEDANPRNKKKSKLSASYFIEDEAEVDEDEEEYEYGDEDELGDDDFVDKAPAVESAASSSARRSYAALMARDRSVEEIAQEFEERAAGYYEDEEEEDIYDESVPISQQSLLPSVRDPKLWMIKCKVGKEKEIAVSMMQKFLDRQETEERLAIKSVVCPDHLKGHVYVEAEKEGHVREAIKGIRDLFQFQIKLVPIKEMVDVLQPTKKPVSLDKSSWVRVMRGVYKGDIAHVLEHDEAKGRAMVKLIPRLDFNSFKKNGSQANDEEKRKRKSRPPARFFNPDEVIQMGLQELLERKRDPRTGELYYIFAGSRYQDGYLYKPLNIKSLDTRDIVPTLDELQKFQEKRQKEDEDEGEDHVESLALPPIKAKKKTIFSKGDTVRVVEGDLRHLTGVVESVDDNMVTIIPKHQDLHEPLTFPSDQLQKSFKQGDHCKVIAGAYEGETGLVVKAEENIITLISDLSIKEIRVLAQDIQECTEVTSGRLELGSYELHDLVQLGNSVGMIVKIERDSFKVLGMNGEIQTVLLQEMGNKRNYRNASSVDAHHNTLNVNDMVEVLDGPYKGRQGTIKHLFRYTAFIHCKDMLESGGIFVAKTANVALMGGSKHNVRARTYGAPAFPPQSPRHHVLSSPRHNDPRNNPNRITTPRGGGAERGARRNQKDKFLNETVIILKGPWKGYMGIVKDCTDTTARVELHTNCKTINVHKDQIQLAAELRQQNQNQNQDFANSREYPATPSHWGRTPMREDVTATPLRMNTPLRTIGTPSHDPWNPAVPNTPRADTPRSWVDDDNPGAWTPGSTHSDYSVGTPSQAYPAYSPYSPAPPSDHSRHTHDSSMYNPSTPSPYSSVNTPGTGYTPSSTNYSDHPTPSESTPRTPYSTSTPSTPLTPSTPGVPATPATPSTPSTPGVTPDSYESGTPYDDSGLGMGQGSAYESDMSRPWPEPDIEVKYSSGRGIVKEVHTDGTSVVAMLDRPDTMPAVPVEALEPVVPSKKDRLKVIRGEFKGNSGVLIGVYGNDGIVKMDSNLDIKILPMNHIAKLAQ